MKKAVIILLLSIYALSSFGIGIKQFYCCGKLTTTHINFAHSNKLIASDKKSCCQTIFQFLKVSDTHGAAADIAIPGNDFAVLDLFTPVYQSIAITSFQITGAANRSNAPPLHSGVPIFVFNCIYRL